MNQLQQRKSSSCRIGAQRHDTRPLLRNTSLVNLPPVKANAVVGTIDEGKIMMKIFRCTRNCRVIHCNSSSINAYLLGPQVPDLRSTKQQWHHGFRARLSQILSDCSDDVVYNLFFFCVESFSIKYLVYIVLNATMGGLTGVPAATALCRQREEPCPAISAGLSSNRELQCK